MLPKLGKGSVVLACAGVRMRPAPNPADRNSSLAGSSSKRKQGMSGWPEIAEEVLPRMILPGVTHQWASSSGAPRRDMKTLTFAMAKVPLVYERGYFSLKTTSPLLIPKKFPRVKTLERVCVRSMLPISASERLEHDCKSSTICLKKGSHRTGKSPYRMNLRKTLAVSTYSGVLPTLLLEF